MANPRNLKKLIELQKLGSTRLEQALAAANARKGALDEEREALIAMQDRRYDGDTLDIDPSLLIKRLGTNAAESQQLEQRLEFDIDPRLLEQFGTEASTVIRKHFDNGERFVLVSSPEARPYIRMIIERLFATLPVLSHVEIARGVEVKSLGAIS